MASAASASAPKPSARFIIDMVIICLPCDPLHAPHDVLVTAIHKTLTRACGRASPDGCRASAGRALGTRFLHGIGGVRRRLGTDFSAALAVCRLRLPGRTAGRL